MVVTTEDIDKYSEKKFKQSATMNGEIFKAMINFSLYIDFLVGSSISSFSPFDV